MSDSDTSDEDFCPVDKEESEEDSDCNEDGIDKDVDDIEAKSRRRPMRVVKEEDDDVKKEEIDSDEDKSRTDALWKDFLSDVKPETQTNVGADKNNLKNIDNKDVLSSADNINPTSQRNIKDRSKLKSPELNLSLTNPAPNMLKRAFSSRGLSAVLSITNKKQKKSILDSSLQDWKDFKKDEGLQEELKEYNKGKDGYLDRQDFLKRTDDRQFEMEKNLRRTRHK